MSKHYCCVCMKKEEDPDNKLVLCKGQGCKVIVHQGCYGIESVPSSRIWYCKKCVSQERAARVRCELCPTKDGAYKRTDQGGWAHVVCALYIPEVTFGNLTSMEPIVTSKVPRDRLSKICSICEERGMESSASCGACLPCKFKSCKVQFHATCAQRNGLLCEEEDPADASCLVYSGYCAGHLKKQKIRRESLLKQLKLSRDDHSSQHQSVSTDTASPMSTSSGLLSAATLPLPDAKLSPPVVTPKKRARRRKLSSSSDNSDVSEAPFTPVTPVPVVAAANAPKLLDLEPWPECQAVDKPSGTVEAASTAENLSTTTTTTTTTTTIATTSSSSKGQSLGQDKVSTSGAGSTFEVETRPLTEKTAQVPAGWSLLDPDGSSGGGGRVLEPVAGGGGQGGEEWGSQDKSSESSDSSSSGSSSSSSDASEDEAMDSSSKQQQQQQQQQKQQHKQLEDVEAMDDALSLPATVTDSQGMPLSPSGSSLSSSVKDEGDAATTMTAAATTPVTPVTPISAVANPVSLRSAKSAKKTSQQPQQEKTPSKPLKEPPAASKTTPSLSPPRGGGSAKRVARGRLSPSSRGKGGSSVSRARGSKPNRSTTGSSSGQANSRKAGKEPQLTQQQQQQHKQQQQLKHPDTIEQFLRQQWEETVSFMSTSLSKQTTSTTAGLLSELMKLQAENWEMEERIVELTSQREFLQVTNSQLGRILQEHNSNPGATNNVRMNGAINPGSGESIGPPSATSSQQCTGVEVSRDSRTTFEGGFSQQHQDQSPSSSPEVPRTGGDGGLDIRGPAHLATSLGTTSLNVVATNGIWIPASGVSGESMQQQQQLGATFAPASVMTSSAVVSVSMAKPPLTVASSASAGDRGGGGVSEGVWPDKWTMSGWIRGDGERGMDQST